MHRLFWKLFLSYWALLVLFSAAVVVSSSVYIDRLRAQRDAEPTRTQYSRENYEARKVAATAGVDGLREWIKRVDSEELVPVLMLDEHGEDILGREVTPRALELLQRMARRDGPIGALRSVIHTSDGHQYRLVRDYQNVTFSRLIGRPRVIALPLLLAALGGGGICFLLARYLVAPIEALKRATQDFAAGNLDRRVAPSLGSRNDEVADLARAMDDMAGRLSTLIGVQQQLLRDISHELRSPLTRLQATLELARRRKGEDPAFDRIEREAERLNELVGRILSLAKLDAGARPARREPLALQELLEEVAEEAQVQLRARDLDLSLELACVGNMEGDTDLLRSAVENILGNAIKHAPDGSAIRIALDAPSLTRYRIRISDEGPGVPVDMLVRIFQPFVRVEGAQSPPGFGLGLAIAERAVRLHGGQITARNREAGGLEVSVELPA